MKKRGPTIIARAEHPISRQMLNANALKVLYRLRDHGFIAYLVGGCVRDLLLGREPKDFDIATSAHPGQVKRLFRNCRLVGRRFRLAHLHFSDDILEVATFRATAVPEGDEPLAEETAHDQRHPQVLKSEDGMLLRDNLFGTPEEDAWRRDFTVNALMYNIADFSLVDYVGGMADLRSGIIRTIGDPWERFTEDPVRMLRAVRFAAMLGFTIEKYAWQAIREMAATIDRAAPPRLYEEVLKLLLLGEGEKTYQILRQSGLFAALFPRMATWLTEETDGYPHTWTGSALVWIDERVCRGENVPPALMLALFFGQYLEEKAAGFRQGGASPPEGLEMAVAEFLAETCPTVMIPQKIGMQLREILLLQLRFSKIPGRKPQVVAARPGFQQALSYLRFSASLDQTLEKTCSWWERYAGELPPVAAEEQAVRESSQGGSPKRRHRRRRRKKPLGSGVVA